jgi:hypothetical protein
MAVTLVVAWDSDLETPLAVRRVAHMREAREEASELLKEYGWSPRISFYQEVDFTATEAGMTEAEVKRAAERLARHER